MNKVKTYLIRFLVALLTLQGVVASELINISSAHASESSVVINEIMWMGSSVSSSDEWIELRNTTNASVDISGWQITKAATGGTTLTVPNEKSIPANGYFLISNFSEANSSSILNIAPNWVTTSIALSNTCSQIDLLSALGTVTDSMGCSAAEKHFFPALSTTNHSLERNIVITDGLLASSWHESVGLANLDATATPDNLATPMIANDMTAPTNTTALVNDGIGVDVDWSASTTQISTNWSNFVDLETSVTDYMVGLGTTPTTADIVSFSRVGNIKTTQLTFVGTENTKYFTLVQPINGVGIVGTTKSSDGFTINTVNPATPTNMMVSDVPNDNGGSLKASWSASASLDDITYQLNYRLKGVAGWTTVAVGNGLEKTITGLANEPVFYEFTVEAIDFNGQHSTVSAIVTGLAIDNLVPIIDATKVVVSQNKPGSIDTVAGLAGTSNDPDVVVVILAVSPDDPNFNPDTDIIGEVEGNADGSFPAIGIEDNKYSTVWLVLVDENENISLPLKLTNDIVGPTAPSLNKAVAKCESETCRVNLDWSSGSADTVSYKVTYITNEVANQTFEVSALSMALDLPTGKSYLFKVVGYDQFGNVSQFSNIFSIALTKGVKTTVNLVNGVPITSTEAISGSVAVKSAPIPKSPAAPAQFVPKVKAAEPVVETPAPPAEPTEPTTPLVADTTQENNDWVRILVVVVLLLIIAGSFYALSRSVQETPEEEFDRKEGESKDSSTTDENRRRRRHRNRRR